MSELAKRIISALVLGPLVLVLVWLGGVGFAGLLALGAALVAWEWSRVTRSGVNDAATVVAIGGAGVAVMLGAFGLWLAALTIAGIGAVAAQLLALRVDAGRLLWLGVLYAALPALALVLLRNDPAYGLTVVVWLLAVVWATDIGAYFAGRLIGGARLWPALSPNKTWSGAIGGVAAGLAAGTGVLLVALPGAAGSPAPAVLAVLLSIVSQFGDLGESALKRHFGVKDSSQLIPGHGGLMDRVDGVVAAALAAGVIGVLRGGPDAAGAGVLLW